MEFKPASFYGVKIPFVMQIISLCCDSVLAFFQ